MDQLRAGFFLAISSAREMLRLWHAFWKVSQPWSLLYIALLVLDTWRYPQGNPSWMFALLWAALFLGISLLLMWNWANALVGARGHVDFSHGWENPDCKDYIWGMLMVMLLIPLALGIALALPLTLISLLLDPAGGGQSASVIVTVVAGALLYINARLLPMSAALIARQVTPLPAVWRLTDPVQTMVVAALATLILLNVATLIITGFIATLLEQTGLPRPDLLVMPLSIAAYLFMSGWLVLLSQRVHALLTGAGRERN